MKKRITAFVLVLAILVSIAPAAFGYTAPELSAANALYTMGLFQGTGTDNNGQPIYELDGSATREQALVMLIRLLGKESEALSKNWSCPFKDVSSWAKKYVGYAYTEGITNGQTSTTFGGEELVSARDYITFVLRALGYSSDSDFSWATAYKLSDELGFTSGEYNASTVIDRGQMVTISYNALGVNKKGTETTLLTSLVESGTVVADSVTAAGADKLLAGLDVSISQTKLTASEVYSKCSKAAFLITVYSSAGKATATGSGFFVTSDGVAVTCYHVIDNTASAKITTKDNVVYPVTNVIYYNVDRDIAVIRVSKTSTSGSSVSSFPSISIGSSASVEVGETVYALGSPLGLEDTFSNGMISSTNRVDGGQTFLQTTASISSGSSGGALLNEYGQVIGVTAASYTSGQSLNLAIPIDCIKSVDFTKTGDTYASVQQKLYGSSSTTTTKASYYSQFPDVPDFGTSLGVSLAGTTKESGYTIYMYRASDVVSAGLASTYEKSYTQLLTNSGYSYVTEKSTTSYDMKLYYRSASSRYIYFGLMVVSGTTYVMVMIY